MLKPVAALLIPITLLILTFTALIAATRALAQTQPRGSWLTWVEGIERGEIYLWDGMNTHRFTRWMNAKASSPVWSNDGWLAWINAPGGFDSDLMVWDGQSVRNLSQSSTPKENLHWSPTGRLAWIDRGVGVMAWDRSAGIVLSHPSVFSLNLDESTLVWSEDGHLAWTAQPDTEAPTELMVWNGETIINVSNTSIVDDCSPAWSSYGHLAWLVDCNNRDAMLELRVWDGENVTSVDPYHRILFHPIWSSTNRLAWSSAYGNPTSHMHDLYVWNGETSVLASGSVGAYITDDSVKWSPDGDHLAFISGDLDGQYDLFVWNGETITNLTQDTANEYNLAWIDNMRLIYAALDIDGNTTISDVYLWDGESVSRLTHTIGTEYAVLVSPDGRAAWIDAEFYNIYVWDGQSVINITNTQNITTRRSSLSWSPIIP